MSTFPFADLYSEQRRDRAILGDIPYSGPDTFEHGEWHRIASIPKRGSDGAPSELYECRMPTRFFKLVVPAYQDSVNETHAGFEIHTGSGDYVGSLLVEIAKQVAEGMVTIEALRPK